MRLLARRSQKPVAYATIGLVFLCAGVLLSSVEASEIGVVFLVAAAIGLALAQRPSIQVATRLTNEAVLEGDTASIELEVESPNGVPWLELSVPAPAGVRSRNELARRDVLAIGRSGPRRIEVRLTPQRWGIYRIGPVAVSTRDSMGFFAFEAASDEQPVLRVFPREERVAHAIRPAETQLFTGDEVSRQKGEGIEFAGVRQFEPGDPGRRINWSVSTRLQKLHINELHPERNADVVVFLDSFSELGDRENSTLLMAVRATATIARHYLRRRDRVGLVTFGGTVRWQVPSMGVRQAYRIIDALLRTDAMLSYAWKGIGAIPVQTLPAGALVVAVSPLMDKRTRSALLELRGRGFDLVVVEVSPLPFVERPRTEEEMLAFRLWTMRREATRFELWSAGIPVATWTRGEPLVAALEEVDRFRRSGRNLRIS